MVLFGDNLEKKGMGGMAFEWRHHPRAIGIPTKIKPQWGNDAYFSDSSYQANTSAIERALAAIPPETKIILVPTNIGKGMAKLDRKAPMTYTYLIQAINRWHKP